LITVLTIWFPPYCMNIYYSPALLGNTVISINLNKKCVHKNKKKTKLNAKWHCLLIFFI
jgi:hypothetical protein